MALLRQNSPETLKVKAAGGISSIEDAKDFINLGADRLGTSRIVKIAMAMEAEQAAAKPAEEPAPAEEPVPAEPEAQTAEEPAPAEEPEDK